MPCANTASFDAARAAKVEEIKLAAATLRQAASTAASQLTPLRDAVLQALDTGSKSNQKVAKFGAECAKELVTRQTESAIALAQAESVTIPPSPAVSTSLMEYLQVLRSLKAAQASLDEVDRISGIAALVVNAYDKSGNAKLKEASGKLDGAMAGFDNLASSLGALATGQSSVLQSLKELRTADYYLARSALEFANNELVTAREALAKLEPSENVSADQLSLIQDTFACYEQLLKTTSQLLASVPADSLVPVEVKATYTGDVAWAYKDGGYYEMAKDAAQKKTGPPAQGPGLMDLASMTWQGIRNMPSAMVEMADLYWNTAKNTAHGVFVEGKSPEQAKQEQLGLWQDAEQRFKAGSQGSGVLRGARDGMEGMEDMAEFYTSELAKKATTGYYIPEVSGKVAKAVVGMFTGLAKGLYVLADPTSSGGELAGGLFDVGASAIGGSKVIARPSMLQGAGKSFWQWLRPAGVEAAKEGLETAATAATSKALVATNLALKDRLKALGAAWVAQAGKTAGESLYDFAKKEFAANLSGFRQALTTIIGERGGTFIDNVVGELVDNVIQGMVVDVLGGPSYDGFYTGSISGGSSGKVKFTIKGTSVNGSISGSYKGDSFSGGLSGSFDPKTRKLKAHFNGSLTSDFLGKPSTWKFGGDWSGTASDASTTISGKWNAGNSFGKASGSWSASK